MIDALRHANPPLPNALLSEFRRFDVSAFRRFSPAFTLVEMLTVVVIIALLLAMTLPGFVRVWEERKGAAVQTTLHGVLTSTRAKALHRSEQGLFFYVDPVTGHQMIVPIVPDPPNDDPQSPEYQRDCSLTPPDPITSCITDLMTENRFRVVEGDVYELPPPIRVAPREIVDQVLWTEAELAHDRYNQAPSGGWPAPHAWPRHRNFFTVIFGPDGKLLVGREVIIHDIALRQTSGQPFPEPTGYRTKLRTGDPTDYYTNNPASGTETAKLDAAGSKSLYDIIFELGTLNAINFPSVDGVLVYDESALADTPYQAGQSFKREYLLKNGQPIYVSPLTGEIVEGPKGENQ
ncbi:MAG: prepilin-type N-terminal cleavage/methylation domain-containing protein [Planctomycetota bacterium]